MPKTIHESRLPNRVRALRKLSGLTQEELAPRLNVTAGHLANLERGNRELTLPVMLRLAEALNVLPADLLKLDDGGLNPEERTIVETYRETPAAMRRVLMSVVDALQCMRSDTSTDGQEAG